MYNHWESQTEVQLTIGDYESQELCLLISRSTTKYHCCYRCTWILLIQNCCWCRIIARLYMNCRWSWCHSLKSQYCIIIIFRCLFIEGEPKSRHKGFLVKINVNLAQYSVLTFAKFKVMKLKWINSELSFKSVKLKISK